MSFGFVTRSGFLHQSQFLLYTRKSFLYCLLLIIIIVIYSFCWILVLYVVFLFILYLFWEHSEDKGTWWIQRSVWSFQRYQSPKLSFYFIHFLWIYLIDNKGASHITLVMIMWHILSLLYVYSYRTNLTFYFYLITSKWCKPLHVFTDVTSPSLPHRNETNPPTHIVPVYLQPFLLQSPSQYTDQRILLSLQRQSWCHTMHSTELSVIWNPHGGKGHIPLYTVS